MARALGTTLLLTVLLGAAPTRAQVFVVDRVVAVVDDDAIFLSELDAACALSRTAHGASDLRTACLDELIDRHVLRRTAAREGITVTDAELEDEVRRLALGLTGLGALARRYGVPTFGTLRERLREKLIEHRVLVSRPVPAVVVSEEDIRVLYATLEAAGDVPPRLEAVRDDLHRFLLGGAKDAARERILASLRRPLFIERRLDVALE